MVSNWPIDYTVITSVDRDDLPDGGAAHFADTVRMIKRTRPSMLVECLVPDFQGNKACVETLVDSGLEVFAHNVETVRSLTRSVRDHRAKYDQSLEVLRYAKEYSQSKEETKAIVTKTSLMLGLGETDEEVFETLKDIRAVGVDCLTLGQYVQPTKRHLKVKEYVHPDKYDHWAKAGRKLGFLYVASGPLVRSSYKAGEFYMKNIIKTRKNQI
ncbi:hypothetical protein Ciccas_010407 [Cichlidogyrus casuarinus]|uniref:Lipoyl synthase, mitochondrial n=1 Tax=Cichlidogyrus casuarinus TaxID=1844966 RepID=A0ABD2PV09_9PLAT